MSTQVSLRGEPAARLDGMGALSHPHGVGFRVWAPHADAVHVTGTFNDWSADATALTAEGNGHWYADVAGAAPGHEYRFLITNGDRRLNKIDPYARQVTNSVGNAVIYDHSAFDWLGDVPRIVPHNELVIYEVHIGSFHTDGSSAPGTFEVAMGKFDHLERLGVNAVQVMPVAEFAGDYSWGYNPAHPFAVETAYGGPDAFKAFVREAHRRGMAVILDVVYNHLGPSDLDLWQFDGWSENDGGGIYFYNDERARTPWGETRPDYGREEVRRYLHSNAMMWLHDYHVDGLRLDMTPYIRSVNGSGIDLPDGWDLMRWINLSIREQYPGRIAIAEDMQADPRISQVEGHGAAFHAQWDGAFVHPVREAVIVADDGQRSIRAVQDALLARYNDDAFQRVIYTESHDEVANGRARVPYEVDPGEPTGWYAQKRSTLGAALTLTAPGIPMLFQGQEFMQGEWFRDDVPLDWDLRDDLRGIVRLYRDLIALRRNLSGTTKGLTGQYIDVYHANDIDKVMAYQRWAEHGIGDDVVVVVNLGGTVRDGYRIGMPADGRWNLLFNSDSTRYGPDFAGHPSRDLLATGAGHDGMGSSAEVSIAPYTMLIYGYGDGATGGLRSLLHRLFRRLGLR